MSGPRYVVVGMGNEYREDDGAGLAVAERLRGRVPAGVTVVPCEQEPSRLIDAWQDADAALVVDAVRSGAEPGTVHRFDAGVEALPTRVFRSSPTPKAWVDERNDAARAPASSPASKRCSVPGSAPDATASTTTAASASVPRVEQPARLLLARHDLDLAGTRPRRRSATARPAPSSPRYALPDADDDVPRRSSRARPSSVRKCVAQEMHGS